MLVSNVLQMPCYSYEVDMVFIHIDWHFEKIVYSKNQNSACKILNLSERHVVNIEKHLSIHNIVYVRQAPGQAPSDFGNH